MVLAEFTDYVTVGTAVAAALGAVSRRLRKRRRADEDPETHPGERAGSGPAVIAAVLRHVPDGATVQYRAPDGGTLTVWRVPPQSVLARQGHVRPW
ncbi:hypothetical protein [Streptomyces sp. NPDC059894]|uniref:hypothetical protein n=1 Tax=unclassified Streptomyces TaxID=2593676 RepID=UPI00365E309A